MSAPTSDPLFGLDSINWSQLNHAYGSADDVPVLLKQLQSTDPEVYLTAFDAFWSNIYHQGTRYSASVEAVPFLYALFDHQTTKNRDGLLYMITSLAVGHPDWSIPDGVDLAKWQQQINNYDATKHGYALDEFRTYEAAEKGLAFVIRSLREESPLIIKITAAHHLAYFPRQIETSVPALLNLIGRDRCLMVRSTAVLALAILFAPTNDQSKRANTIHQIRSLYNNSCDEKMADEIFTWSCAVALLILGIAEEEFVEKARRVLTDEAYLCQLEEGLSPDTWFPFAMFGLRNLATTVLSKRPAHQLITDSLGQLILSIYWSGEYENTYRLLQDENWANPHDMRVTAAVVDALAGMEAPRRSRRLARVSQPSDNTSSDPEVSIPHRARRTRPASNLCSSSERHERARKPHNSQARVKKYAHLPLLRDTLVPNLICVFVGMNPGIQTATAGHAYAHPSNHFWRLLHTSGCTDRRCLPEEDGDLPHLYAMGNTNLVGRPSRTTSELSKQEMAEGTPILEDKIRRYKPEAVCFVGKGIWEAVWRWRYGRDPTKEEFKYGWQAETENLGKSKDGTEEYDAQGRVWSGAAVFVATSTSGLAASLSMQEKEAIWNALGGWVQKRREDRSLS
ncbi:tdg mug dna glycosylase [Fusarium sporotrichioides]|uniref:Tdg mug dna glycosylase n=1 Tax=Fusarium sporotrichioides TaxID=5514 RepID=A0A395RSZ2_FUSSP|nr:tdg mug dna glycosylase [Fusarium sporotrichioides]